MPAARKDANSELRAAATSAVVAVVATSATAAPAVTSPAGPVGPVGPVGAVTYGICLFVCPQKSADAFDINL